MADASIRFVDFVVPLVRRRKLVFWLVFGVAIASIVTSLLWPKSWRASVTLLPPERRMDNPLFVPGGFEGLGASLRGITLRHVATPTDIFVAILESRNVREALVNRFDLLEEYGVSSMAKAVIALRDNTTIVVTPDGTIRIRAVASSPQGAADLANAYVEELDRVNRTLAFREASAIREFIQKELDEAKTRLAASEDALRTFQETHGAIEITEQARAVIGAAAQINAQIVAAEVELGVLQRTLDESHPQVAEARGYLNELRLRLAEIEGERDPTLVQVEPKAPAESLGSNGDSPHVGLGASEPAPEIFPPLSRVPALGLEFGRLYRELKIEEAVMTLLTEQYQRARIEERRSLPTVRVLDQAVPPERRFRPRRTIMVLASTGAALSFALLLAYALEIVERTRRDPSRYPGLHEATQDLKKGLRT